MSTIGGPREGSGRKPGSPNKRSAQIVANAAAEGVTPVEYMLAILRDENASDDARRWAAEKAAPFVHPKPAPIQRLVTLDLPPADTADGVRQAFARLIAAVAAGELSPSEAQSFASLIEGQRKAIETADLQQRLEALEQAIQGKQQRGRPA